LAFDDSPEWGVEPIPAKARRLGGFDLFVLWSSLGVGLLVLAAGGLLVPALGFRDAFLAIVAGSVAGSTLLALVGYIGSRTGAPTMVCVRPGLGLRGAVLPAVLNTLQLIGWTVFELIVMAQAADAIVSGLLGFSSYPLWVAFFTAVVVAMGVLGPLTVVRQWLEKFAIWVVYASALYITLYLASRPEVWGALLGEGEGGLSLLTAIDIVVAMPISWMPLVADYTRFSKSGRRSFLGVCSGYTLANTWFYALGALLVLVVGTQDVVAAIAQLGFGLLALALILVDETDNAFADLYSAAVSTQSVAPGLRQRRLILAYGVLSFILALTIPLAEYETFLLLIGAVFVPLFGVVLTDYFALRRTDYTYEALYRPRRVNWRGMVAWAGGALTYYLLTPLSPLYQAALPDIGASLPSLLVSALLYYILAATTRSP
jgi:putative hydroxymethylpyrimidine transporter CytX